MYSKMLSSLEKSVRELVDRANKCKEYPNFIEDSYLVGYYSGTANAVATIAKMLEESGIDVGEIKVTKIKRL